MVLAALADFIYNVYLVLYYIFTTTSFVGFLVYDTTYNAVRILLWCIDNINVFMKIVFEDNQQIIQDSKTVLLGTADFFINNIAKVFQALCFIVVTFRDALLAVWSLLGLTLWSVKQALILTGQAIWLLFTAPYQQLLEELINRASYSLIKLAQRTYSKCAEALADFSLFIAHDVPLEAACGLGLLVLTCFYPAPAKVVLQLVSKAALFSSRFLRRKTQQCLQRMLSKVYLHFVRFCQWMCRHAGRISNTEFQPMFAEVVRLFTIQHHTNHAAQRQSPRREDNPQERRDFQLFLRRVFAYVRSFFVFNSLRREVPHAQPPVCPPARRTSPAMSIGSCIICEDDDRAVAFVPCGHLCVCKTCASHIIYYNPVCPLCRSYIEKKLEVYI